MAKKRKTPLFTPSQFPSRKNSLTITIDSLAEFEPQTPNQEIAYKSWLDGDHLVLTGTAGTGKTYLALSLAFEAVLDETTDYDHLVIVRSIVSTRDPGHLPGTKEEKESAFYGPYKSICEELFGDHAAFDKLLASKMVSFNSTSFIRGTTWNNAIVVVDEMQNLNYHELDTVITRVGKNCRIIFSGDYKQTDFKFQDEKEGIFKFMHIIEHMNNFSIVTFSWQDIVRSGLVRDYIMTKEMLGID